MKVALGTYEVSEEERRTIKRAMGFKGGKASREDARAFILAAAADAIDATRAQRDPEEAIAAAEAEEDSHE